MFACLGLINWSNQNNTKLGIYAAYLILVLVSVFRYDIGNDYQTYTEIIRYIAYKFESNIPYGDDSKEPLITILTIIFKDLPYTYVWVLGVHFIISLAFLYKAFEDNESHILGILIFFISGLMFIYWDQVRQAVAISIIIYATKYIKENNFFKYVLFVFLAASAHYSALLLVPFFFVNKITPRRYIYIGIILGLALSNAATGIFERALTLIPYWESKTDKFSYVQLVSLGYKIRTFFYALVWSTIIFYLPKKEKALSHFIFIGAVIFIISSGALNVMRISFYFIFTMMISIPIVLKIEKARTIMIVMVSGLFLFFVRDVITDTGTNGCVPYDSIFSDNFPDYFRSRD
jgi:hypothetical protein